MSQKQVEESIQYANVAAVITILTLDSQDLHFKQALASIEYALNKAKDRLKEPVFTKEHEKKLSSILVKIKKAYLTREEKLSPYLPADLELELSIYESLVLE